MHLAAGVCVNRVDDSAQRDDVVAQRAFEPTGFPVGRAEVHHPRVHTEIMEDSDRALVLVTSNTLADIIIGGTSITGGRDGSFAPSGKYSRNRYMSHRSTIWNGDGRDPV